jgi:nucleoside-diphosphate-sugar epimerase
MKILVIGANGRLGKACVRALPDDGATVIAFVRTKTTFPADLGQRCAVVVDGDARDQVQLEAALRENACDGLVQVAGYTPFFPGVATDQPRIFVDALAAASKIARERSAGDAVTPVSG